MKAGDVLEASDDPTHPTRRPPADYTGNPLRSRKLIGLFFVGVLFVTTLVIACYHDVEGMGAVLLALAGSLGSTATAAVGTQGWADRERERRG